MRGISNFLGELLFVWMNQEETSPARGESLAQLEIAGMNFKKEDIYYATS